MLDSKQIDSMIQEYGSRVNEGRTIEQIVYDGDLPRLQGTTIIHGKVSDSVFGDKLKTRDGKPIRLMYRQNRISTHDQNRGEIPFKDQVLAHNHDYMLQLTKDAIGTSQFDVPGLSPSSTVIPSENLDLIMVENVMRMFMAQSSTSTSLYQHWLKAIKEGTDSIDYAGHSIDMKDLTPNGKLPYLMDTPSTKEKSDKTIDPNYLFENNICTPEQYNQIRNSSMMAFGIVSGHLRERGMVLVDTKTEHGINSEGKIVSADELYTLDSSRFWKLEDSGEIMYRDGEPVSFSKEFARGMIKEGGQMFTQEQSREIGARYIQGLQYITGQEFKPDLRPRDKRIIDSTNLILDYLGVN